MMHAFISIVSITLILVAVSENCDGTRTSDHLEKIYHHEIKTKRHRELANEQCTKSEKTRLHHHRRFPRALPDSKKYFFGKAAYFSGDAEVIRYKLPKNANHNLPREAFAIEAWLKPEGGQRNKTTTIVGLHDACGMSITDRGWSIGIHSNDKDSEQNAKLYFSLRSDRSRDATIITAHNQYEPNHWVHVAASYDGTTMVLYINGAKVATSSNQRGDIFSRSSSQCKELDIGGNPLTGTFYRGVIDEVILWSEARSHVEIKDSIYSISRRKENLSKLDVYEDFSDMNDWDVVVDSEPRIINSDMPSDFHDVTLKTNACSETVCDDPDVTISYTENWSLRKPKTLRYRVINVYEDDQTNPTVSQEQIHYQHRAINVAFNKYNISWELTIVNVTNTALRRRAITYGCDISNVGNGVCDDECRHERTGNDGGDCDEESLKGKCEASKQSNGKCDSDCNNAYHNWDGGDCCLGNPGEATQCYDPRSSNRVYLDVDEYKTLLGFDNSEYLSIYFAQWTNRNLQGIATFPWEKEVYDILGGIILQPDHYGKPAYTKSMVHELGHVLGLWHTHHGISEMGCTDECLEIYPSLELGDLIADTYPTPLNQHCRDPKPNEFDKCGIQIDYINTPFRNYMGYADNACIDNFTPQQRARMHCYIDLIYKPWQDSKTPSMVPLPPKIISKGEGSISMAWVPSLSLNLGGPGNECNECSHDNTLIQYAKTAYSPNPSWSFGDTSQATGPPDAEHCDVSGKAWMPKDIDCENCYIELGFETNIVPIQLSIWVAWNPSDGIKDVVLVFKDGTEQSLGAITAYCDMPYTTQLFVGRRVIEKVRIHVTNQYVSIDAVQLTSEKDHPVCKECKPLRYIIHRTPAFTLGEHRVTVQAPYYHDSDLSLGTQYVYNIQAVQGGQLSEMSPSLLYTHGQSFCGDGVIDRSRNEECDDGNAINQDGCNLNCKIDEFFHCKGEPSLCYLHDGDGICEDFEQLSSVRDCGFYTPPGYSDQYATTAVANPMYQHDDCPESVVIGEPHLSQKCEAEIDPSTAWRPCNVVLNDGDYWLRVGFDRPLVATTVIIYIASDGASTLNFEPNSMSIDLIDTADISHPLGTNEIMLFCKDNPIHVGVVHDLSKPFYLTKAVLIKFTSPNIAISAVALRSHNGLDPITLAGCHPGELYNPATKQCTSYQCKKPMCNKLTIKHASSDCQDNDKDYVEGDICKVKCINGYVPNESKQVLCVGGNWQGLSSLSCMPINCGTPNIAHAEVVCSDGTTFGKQCSFKCIHPAKMQGTDNTVVCESDGMFSLPDAFCQLMCDAPQLPTNAILANQKCQHSGHNVGTSCKFRCKAGYYIKGQPYSRSFRHVCGEDAEWHGQTCEPVQCEPPPLLYYGMYNCTDGYNSGSECKLRCPGESGDSDKFRLLSANFTLSPYNGAESLFWMFSENAERADSESIYHSRTSICGNNYVLPEKIKFDDHVPSQFYKKLVAMEGSYKSKYKT
uniref:Pappalysin-1-like n=1 Tax=Saccoglossus kowalevskii TaxID=10224 RepID=A0ABM0MAU4_SACKO|nr:PREDICTED: pappalysin-1-like [Saccoglossus kowalevskii]